MKKEWIGLARKLFIFLLLITCFDYLVGKLYGKLEVMALDHSPYGMVTEYTMRKVKTDVVIIGASEVTHSYIPSILEDSLKLSVYNCGKDGCFFFYQNAMIHGILDRYSPRMILWSITPNELNAPTETDMMRLSQLNPFYLSNSFSHEVLRHKSKYESVKLMSNSYVYNSRLFPFLFKIFIPDNSFEKGGYLPLYGSNKDLEIKKQEWKDNYLASNYNIISNTLERCRQSNVPVLCIFTPFYGFGDYHNIASYKALKQILADKGVPLIEQLYHDSDLMKTEYFKDNAHLNNDGAIEFNKKLSTVLNQKMN